MERFEARGVVGTQAIDDRLLRVCMLALASLSSACITLKDVTNANTPLGDDFKLRTLYKDSAAIRDDLSDFVGHVVTIDAASGTATKSFKRYVISDARPAPKTIPPDSGLLYESKIDKKFSTNNNVSYLATISTQISGEQMVDVIIRDISVCSLTSNQIDLSGLKADLPLFPPTAGITHCFVQGARTASVNTKLYSEVTGTVKAAYGETFQSNNSLYSSDSDYLMDYKVSMDCIDLDKLGAVANALNLSPGTDQLTQAVEKAVSSTKAVPNGTQREKSPLAIERGFLLSDTPSSLRKTP